ncbi:MAG TPA: sensor histidine kinase, partial [Verrucomicrobiae bacterium]|nr:sensor histidine kinase [Verrucomicrobiae bacterium]
IDFAEYAASLLNYLWRSHGSAAAVIRLTLRMQALSLPVDMAVPCGLMLNELAGNALKHAFAGRGSGEVRVSLQRDETGRAVLSVRDDGVGLAEGFDWRSASSLGLRLVQMLAAQMKAEVELDRSDGTAFRITFELPQVKIGEETA